MTGLVPIREVLSVAGAYVPESVHVWLGDLIELPADVLAQALSDDELRQAGRMLQPARKEAFIAGRALLREVLAAHGGAEPAELAFGYSAYGKPHVTWPQRLRRLEFNVAHARGSVLIVVSDRGRVGVDVEDVRHDLPFEQMARQVFTDAELAILERSDFSPSSFFRLWTRREALLKGMGFGFSAPQAVLAMPPEAWEAGGHRAAGASVWRIADLDAGPNLTAAVAVEAV